ncbi:MAG: hypothetical protein RJA99_4580 [Pseudomonadota bacterium]|jgi:uncharacterized protein (TIGR00369 family)
MTAHPVRPRRSADEQARLHRRIVELFERRVRFNEVIGLEVTSLDPTEPKLRFRMRPELIGNDAYGQLHGGVTAAALDTTAGFALTVALCEKFADEPADVAMARFARIGTIDLRIDYLRRGLGQWFEASAKVTRLGGRIGSVQMALHADDGTLIATGAAAFTVG